MPLARPSPLLDQHRPISFDTSREREFFKYLPTWHSVERSLNHIEENTQTSDFTARTCPDTALTAFAQLGALRLDAQRVLISLFGRHDQHILTEATRTLSLEDDTDHTPSDELWVGSCTMSYARSFCASLVPESKSAQSRSEQALIVSDLSQDEKFKNHPDVKSSPNVRFMALSPIVTSRGIVIGAYTVLDDKPRQSHDPAMIKFLSSMSTTVMNYLDASRSQAQHLRAERMIVGIGSFLEGKGSLRNSWLGAGTFDYADDQDTNPEGKMNEKQQTKQVMEDVSKAVGSRMGRTGPLHNTMPLRSHPGSPHRRSPKPNQNLPSGKPLRPLPASNDRKQKSGPPSDDDHKSQVAETFSRGANIIRESIEVEAVLFFDANFASRGPNWVEEKSDQEASCRDSYSSGSADEGKIRGAFTSASHQSTANADDSGSSTLNACTVLGFSTSDSSSVNGELVNDKKIAVSESFLASLLHRYPQGKIFNFFADGSISASETSDGTYKDFSLRNGNQAKPKADPRPRSRKYKQTRKAILRQDAETLLKLAPDARSIIFSPLWDSHKGRWSSASIAWTRSPHRVFTSDDELPFMFAFGNSIMAEVHRLSAFFAEQSKSSLLAGLSHELRSPLHGIFGMADLLNTSVINTLQRGFIHTISSCAFTLLGSINQLLEYASIKDLQSSAASAQYSGGPSRTKLVKAGEDLQREQVDPDSYVQLDVTMEDAIETVFAGYSFFNGLQFPLDATHDGSFFKVGRFDGPDGVQVILDIESSRASDWTFFTRPGAWHVILTNLVGNALKFTRQGYIHVSLKTSPNSVLGEDGEVIRSNVVITVKDTGCGISPEFLQNGLFLPFSQEDEMTTGNGLGLNMTQRIVLSLGGTIQIDSEQGVGTEVTVSVHLDHVSALSTLDLLRSSTDPSLEVAKDLVQGKTIRLIGLGTSKSDQALQHSLEQLCRNWFQMNVTVPPEPESPLADFYIARFELVRNGTLDIEPLISSPTECFSSPVIVVCPSPRIAHSMYVEHKNQRNSNIVEFISQPCGPRKLAKTFEICSKRQRQRIESVDAAGDMAHRSVNLSIPLEGGKPEDPSIEGLDLGSGDPPIDRDSAQLADEHTPTDSHDSEVQSSELDPRRDDNNAPSAAPDSGNDADLGLGDSDMKSSDEFLPQPQPQATTILIVDDNHINVRILIQFMKNLGCEYQSASNGLQAVEIFEANASSIGIIFMDISMPVMNGLEASRRIRDFEQKSGAQNPVKIVALTGVAQDDLQRDTIRSGMDTFLTKPARLENLVPLINDSGIPTQGSPRPAD